MDTNILASILSDEVWDQVLGFESIEDSVTCFNLVMQALLDAMVPLKKVRIKTDTPSWANDQAIIGMRRMRDGLHQKAIKSGNWIKYKRETRLIQC